MLTDLAARPVEQDPRAADAARVLHRHHEVRARRLCPRQAAPAGLPALHDARGIRPDHPRRLRGPAHQRPVHRVRRAHLCRGRDGPAVSRLSPVSAAGAATALGLLPALRQQRGGRRDLQPHRAVQTAVLARVLRYERTRRPTWLLRPRELGTLLPLWLVVALWALVRIDRCAGLLGGRAGVARAVLAVTLPLAAVVHGYAGPTGAATTRSGRSTRPWLRSRTHRSSSPPRSRSASSSATGCCRTTWAGPAPPGLGG